MCTFSYPSPEPFAGIQSILNVNFYISIYIQFHPNLSSNSVIMMNFQRYNSLYLWIWPLSSYIWQKTATKNCFIIFDIFLMHRFSIVIVLYKYSMSSLCSFITTTDWPTSLSHKICTRQHAISNNLIICKPRSKLFIFIGEVGNLYLLSGAAQISDHQDVLFMVTGANFNIRLNLGDSAEPLWDLYSYLLFHSVTSHS